MKTGVEQLKCVTYVGLILFFALCTLSLKAERVRLFTPNDGLSNSHVNQIYQDSKGYIWIATENGLNKFNGYDFEVYLSVPDDTTSIRANFVTYVYEDSRGIFWVSTSNGLLQHDRTRNTFIRWRMGELDDTYIERRTSYIMEDRNHHLWVSYPGVGVVRLDANTLTPTVFDEQNIGAGFNTITCIVEDQHGNFWFGTENSGVFVFNPHTNTTKHYEHHPSDPSGLSSNIIFTICENYDEIWIGTMGGGINIYNNQTQSFRVLKSDDIYMENLIFSLMLDDHNNVWVGTDGAGIIKYDVYKNKIPFREETSAVCDLRHAKVHRLLQDKQGNIWAGLYQKGVVCISTSGSSFQNIGFNPFDTSKSIGSHCVISIIEDYQGNIWAGTDGDGLYKICTDGKVDHFTTENSAGLLEDVITALFEDKDHNIWIGTYLNGMIRYHPKTGKFDTHYQKKESENSLSNNFVTNFVQDDEGIFWIATMGGGVSVFNPQTRQFRNYMDPDISGNWVFDVMIDREKDIWAVTSNGLNLLNRETDIFEAVNMNDEHQIVSNLMYTLIDDAHGNIWVGSYFGLRHLDKRTKKSFLITTVDGLPDNMIAGIEEDRDHILWISTGNGLCRYDPQTKDFSIFYAEDGIQSNEFRRGSNFKGKNDRMYFGGINGITIFYPSEVMHENPLLDLVFTGFLVNNEPVKVGQSEILKKSIDETTKIRLTYDQRNITFMFAALEFGIPQRVIYETKLENFETQWRQISSSIRSVTYTNLNPGNYVFSVKATIDGKHILQKDIQVVILSPWWWSLPAKVVYFILFVLALYAVYVYLSYRELERRRTQLEQMVEQRTKELVSAKEKAEESDKLKSAFLANMSHEIRTPLNGIVGFLQFINNDNLSPKRRKEYINIINSNTTQLLRIINDIVDISKIEAKQMTITPVPVDINELMNELWVFFVAHLQANNKGHVKLILDESGMIDPCVIYIDPTRLRQVLNNLIGNAVKFTDKGYIRFGYRKAEADVLEFVVDDSGIGLPENQREVIFERFRQADTDKSIQKLYGGTGLGLTISRSLVQLEGGKIWVESTEGLGSSFYFTIPYLPIFPQDAHIFETSDLPSTDEVPFVGKTVVLVEPNDLKFDYYQKLISATGAVVIKAENMKQCHGIILQHKVNVIIVDVSLFVDSEDFGYLRHIKKEREKLPIALIVPERDDKYLQMIRNNLCNMTVKAPIKYADIVKIMGWTQSGYGYSKG